MFEIQNALLGLFEELGIKSDKHSAEYPNYSIRWVPPKNNDSGYNFKIYKNARLYCEFDVWDYDNKLTYSYDHADFFPDASDPPRRAFKTKRISYADPDKFEEFKQDLVEWLNS